MKVRLTRQAQAQLDAVLAYVAGRNAGAASRISGAMELAFEHIARHPELGRADVQSVRRKVVQPGGYLVHYSVDGGKGVAAVPGISHPARQRLHRDA